MRGETTAPSEDAESVRTALLLADVRGWEEHDDREPVGFVFYIARTADADASRARVEAHLARPVRWSQVDEEDWAHAWKRFWKPQRIGRRLVVKPTWEPFEAAPDDVVIALDPGMAFGTGTHATTRMCLEWLEQLVRGGEQVLDVGTGSGLLAVAAARLGAREVRAVDNDPVAVKTATENVALNGVAAAVRVDASDLTAVLPVGARFDLVVANIVAEAIMGLAPQVTPLLAQGASFVASGIIRERAAEVAEAVRAAGLVSQTWREEGEWASVCARRED